MTKKPTYAELEAENARLRDSLSDFMAPEKARLVGFSPEGMPQVKHPMVPLIVETLAQWLFEYPAEVENYLCNDFSSRKHGDFIMTLQKRNGKSPHEKRQEAEAALDKALDAKRQAFRERNRVVIALAHMALRLGMRAGVAEHEPKLGEVWDPAWSTAIRIDLPGGQVSWHIPDDQQELLFNLPAYKGAWDGHDTPEKYRRLADL